MHEFLFLQCFSYYNWICCIDDETLRKRLHKLIKRNEETFFVYKFFFFCRRNITLYFSFFILQLQSSPFSFLVFTQQNDENRRLHGNIVRVKCSIKLNVAENATLFVESVCEMHRERSSRVSWPESGQVVMETEKEGSLYKIVARISTSLCCLAFLNGGISSGYLTNFTLIHWLDFDVALFFSFSFFYFIFFYFSDVLSKAW